MTNKEIMDLYEGLSVVFNKQELRFPAKVSFSLMRNLRTLAPIAEDILASRDIVLQTYGEPVEDKPGYYSIPKENREKAQKEIDALDGVEQDIKILKVKVSDLEGMEFTLEEMAGLYGMLEEE